MKAIQVTAFGGSEQLRLADVPSLVPGPDEIVVSVHAAGVNPVEAYIRSGTHAIKPALPYTPGFDGAGVVARVGSQVTTPSAGDRVYISGPRTGTYAEECLCGPGSVHPLPDRISFEEGAALGIPYLTAYRALFQLARGRPGESVLIHGASGGTGNAAVQLARAHGLRVLGTASTETGRRLVLRSGAHHALDHTSGDMTEQVAMLTGGAGPQVIVEMLANKNLATDLVMVAKRGRIVLVGNRGATEVNMRDAMVKDVTILAMLLFNATVEELAEGHAAIHAGLAMGILKPAIGQTFPLAEAARAHDAVVQQTGGAAGKIVVLPRRTLNAATA
jgi:NADPH:quinone reductase